MYANELHDELVAADVLTQVMAFGAFISASVCNAMSVTCSLRRRGSK
jgi:hypothetical protein